MSSVTIDGVGYQPVNKTGGIRIVVLQRGWVFVGRYQEQENECVLTDAKNYRKQRSGKGLGYVAKNGPSEACVLDPCGLPVRWHPLATILTLDCEKEKWENILK